MLDSPYFAAGFRPVHHEISLSPKNWICFYCGSTNLSVYCEHCNAPKKDIRCVQAPRPPPPPSPRPQICYSSGTHANEYSKATQRLIDANRKMGNKIGREFGKIFRDFMKGFM